MIKHKLEEPTRQFGCNMLHHIYVYELKTKLVMMSDDYEVVV